jgi:hypothetical protein
MRLQRVNALVSFAAATEDRLEWPVLRFAEGKKKVGSERRNMNIAGLARAGRFSPQLKK